MKDKIFGVLQRVGRSFMLPIAILPVAGLLLGIGSSFTNETTIATYGLQKILGSGTLLNSLLIIMNKVGSAVFDNLPLIFAVGVAIGMAKKEKEVAALSALIAYFVMNVAVSAMLLINNEITADGQIAADVLEGTITSVCGIQSLQMGVFGGIIVGLGVAALHNRFHKIVLPNALSFFGGSRFVPIISTITYMFVGIAMYFVWPIVQNGIYALGGLVTGTGYFGTLIFGIVKRALIPFGLHHALNNVFWFDTIGLGDLSHFWAGETSADVSWSLGMYMSGFFPCMMFGIPGAALAMVHTAKSNKKKAAIGLVSSAAIAAFVCGVTEPFEFGFMFLAPALYLVYALLYGIFTVVTVLLGFRAGFSFSAGLTDLVFSASLPAAAKTWLIIPLGIAAFVVFYVVFRFAIVKFDLKTPGREDDDDNEAEKSAVLSNDDFTEVAKIILEGVGGKENVKSIDNCITRLRLEINDYTKVDEKKIKSAGVAGVIRPSKTAVQVIVGMKVQFVADEFKKLCK